MGLRELPEQAQQLTRQGVIPLSAIERLRSIGQVSPELLDAVIGYLGDGNEWAAERLSREPGWVIDSALRSGSSKVFAAHLTQLDSYEIADLRLGKRTEALLDEAATLHKQLDRYAYGAPAVRFTESDVDQARAAGVLVEFERHAERGMTVVMPIGRLCQVDRLSAFWEPGRWRVDLLPVRRRGAAQSPSCEFRLVRSVDRVRMGVAEAAGPSPGSWVCRLRTARAQSHR